MAGNSFTYCDSDEEVFFGKATEKELRKLALLGQTFDSPVCSTPRPKTVIGQSKLASNLPDVLKSTSKTNSPDKPDELPICHLKNTNQSSLKSSLEEDDDVIVIDNTAEDSVLIISDDESFLKNGGSFTDVESFLKNEKLCNSIDIDDSNSKSDQSVYAQTLPPETSELDCGNYSSEKDKTKSQFVTLENESLQSQEGHQTTNISYSVDLKSSVVDSIIQNEEFPESGNIDGSVLSKPDQSVYVNTLPTEMSELDYGSFFSDKGKDNSEIILPVEENIQSNNDSTKKTVLENFDLNSTSTTYESTSNEFQGIVEVHPPKSDTEYPNLSSSQIPEVKAIEDFITKSSHQSGNFKSSPNKAPVSFIINQVNNSPSKIGKQDTHGELTATIDMNQKSVEALSKTPICNQQLENLTAQRIGFTDLDYSSLYAVSDSILNISNGSSLSSPLLLQTKDSAAIVANATYEDVSCDAEQLNVEKNESDTQPQTISEENDEFHMSVDDPDFLHNSSLGNAGATDSSSYLTAFDATSKQSSNQFSKYRDSFDDYRMLEVDNGPTDSEKDVENKNETSFEMVVHNRQNSFAADLPNQKSENISDKKTMSKLPIFKSGASLIKPPILNVRSESLLTTNYKWAKHLPTSDGNKKQDLVKNNFTSKLPCANTGNKALLKTPTETRTPYKKQIPQISVKPKTPSSIRTPSQTLPVSQRAVKSDSKTPSLPKPPVKTALSLEKSNKKTPSLLVPMRDRYKNIISPVRKYITGASFSLQEKAQMPREGNGSSRKMPTNIPVRSTPLKENENTTKKTPRIVQKLNYSQSDNQENEAPDYTRDTLPPKVLEAAAAVFIKENEKPKRVLPKIGETMQKLLMDTPRPKIIIHQGRVKESPHAKGRLFPNQNAGAGDLVDISVRVVKTTDDK